MGTVKDKDITKNGVQKHVHETKVVCTDEKDVEQDARISKIETSLTIMEAEKGKLDFSEIAKFGSIMGVMFALMTAISSMWIESKTEETRQRLESLNQTVTTIKESLTETKKELKILRSAQSDQLDPEVLEQRFTSSDEKIHNVEGRFERITDVRIQRQLDAHEKAIEALQAHMVEELKRSRDLSPEGN